MTILVTGGAGFIGSHVVDELVKVNNCKVVVLDDLSGGFEENVNKQATFIAGSITDHKLLSALFALYEFDYVFHLAAYAAEGLSHFIRRFNYENNLIGSINLINEAVNHNVKCFVFTSSMAVYGTNQVPFTEDMLPAPEDPYGIAKHAVEQELKLCKKMFGLDYIIFRPHNVYGERQNIGDRYRNVVGIFMNQIMRNEPLTIFGDGEQKRAFSYIKDVSPVIAKSIFTEVCYNQIFNIGADEPYTINELAQVVSEEMDSALNTVHLKEREEVKYAYSSQDKIKSLLHYKSTYPLKIGLANMAGWARDAGSRESRKFGKLEILKNIPEKWL